MSGGLSTEPASGTGEEVRADTAPPEDPRAGEGSAAHGLDVTPDSRAPGGRPLPWLRIVAEGVVIVTSILLAFGIDAWWEGRQERSQERVALAALRLEFRENIARFTRAHDYHVASAGRLAALEDLLTASRDGVTVQVPDSLLRPLVSFRTPDPAMGTLNTLLASGRIELVRDPALQQALAGWPAEVEDASEDERMIRDFIFERLIAGLADDVDLSPVMRAEAAEVASDPSVSGSSPLKVDGGTRALIGQRALLGRLVVLQSETRLEAARRILDLIESGSGR